MARTIFFMIKDHLLSSFSILTSRSLYTCFAFITLLFFVSCEKESLEPDETLTSNTVDLLEGNVNMLIGGTLSIEFTDSPIGFSIVNLADNDANTFFSTPRDNFSILWSGTQSIAQSYYSLTSGDDRLMDPKTWTLFASTDNYVWVALDRQVDQVFGDSKEKKEYYFSNKSPYKYYKLVIQKNSGGASTQIAEWTLQIKKNTSIPFSESVETQNTNMPSGGVVTSQYADSPAKMTVINIVDGNDSSKFVTHHDKFYVLWKGTKAIAANNYTITSASDNPEMDPRTWSLSASNDSVTWMELDMQTDQLFDKRVDKKEYVFKNDVAYQYYRLNVLGNNGGESTQIAGWVLQVKDDTSMPFSESVDTQNTNMPSRGTITSQYSDSPTDMTVIKLVDGKSNTKFVTHHDKFYVLWDGKETVIKRYAITSASDNPEMDPKNWTLSASNDSVSWVQLDKQTNQAFRKREEQKEYNVENYVGYKYYMLNILGNNGGESTQIAEWSLKGLPNNINDLMSLSGGRSYSSRTPMGNRFENRRVTTAADKVWLSTASNEPALLSSAPSLTQLKEFPVTLYPYGTPLPADVNQHAIGDCCAMAVFASFAYLYPDFIKDIITDNGNKTYTVAMFDPQGKPVDVTVTSKFLADNNGRIGAATGKSDRATWSTVLEKAMMKWQNLYKVNEDVGGIGTEHVAPLFTGDGDSFAFSANKLNAEQLYRAVGVSLNQGKLVIGGFTKSDVPVSGNHKTVAGHAFTFMYSLDKTALFSMRNPWGGTGDGVLNVPDNGVIAPLIDLRIVNPGKAAQFAKGIPTPYTPPYLAPAQRVVRVSEELLRSGQ